MVFAGHQHAVDLHHQLAIGKHPEVAAKLGSIPHHLLGRHRRKAALVELDQGVNVG
jgi:hypothetical protein